MKGGDWKRLLWLLAALVALASAAAAAAAAGDEGNVVWLTPEVVERRVMLQFGEENATTVAIPFAALEADADYVLTVSCSAATPADLHTAVLNGAAATAEVGTEWHGENQLRFSPHTLARDVTLMHAGVPTACAALRVRATMRGVRHPDLPKPTAVPADLVVSRVRLGLPQRAWPVLATAAAATVVVCIACTVLVACFWKPLEEEKDEDVAHKDE